MTDTKLVGTINSFINSSLPFVFYFNPGETEPEIIIQQTGKVKKYSAITDLKDAQGFVMAPFTISDETPLLLIRPDIHAKGFSAIAELNIEIHERKVSLSPNKPLSADIGKDEYLELIGKTIAQIKANTFEKVVVSRTITSNISPDRSLSELVLDLKAKTQNAFVYLLYTPETGIWIGASPEMLLARKNSVYQTVSLAGTMPLDVENNYNWSANMQREHAIVTEFIESRLLTFKINKFIRNGPFTATSANVVHLKTTFEFSIEKLNGQYTSFIDAIHLSPAVCGYPKEKAKKFIIENETYEREYYTGFLGTFNLEDSLQLYVNIRCMKIINNKAVLYVGGGITANSVPENEWEETNQKAKTLLSVL